jgi:uncharacterized protein (TIGR02594 family)
MSHLSEQAEPNVGAADGLWQIAKAEEGVKEAAGPRNNPRIMQMAREAGFPQYTHDGIPWCALFANWVVQSLGVPGTGKLTARSFLDWGAEVPLEAAPRGSVVVFWRGSPSSWQGHVAFLDRIDGNNVLVLGGNQKDEVNVSAYHRNRVLGVRLPVKPRRASAPSASGAPSFPLIGTGRRLEKAEIVSVAQTRNIPISHIKAVLAVEAAGSGFTADGLLKLLYEPHIMWKKTSGVGRERLRKMGLAYQKWGTSPYPTEMADRHRQIERAYGVVRQDAFLGASYGLGQVLGTNAVDLGYGNAMKMAQEMLKGEAFQLEAMMRFIERNGILDAMKNGDWKAFARVYNGPSYAKHGYHIKLAEAVRMARNGGNPVVTEQSPGHSRREVREAQEMLIELEFDPGKVDGWMGPATAEAIMEFQKAHPDLKNDGDLGPQTMAALRIAVKVKRERAATNVAVPTGVGGAVAVAAAQGWPWWAYVAIGVVALAALALSIWWLRRRYPDEFERIKNRVNGIVVRASSWASRLPGKLMEARKP